MAAGFFSKLLSELWRDCEYTGCSDQSKQHIVNKAYIWSNLIGASSFSWGINRIFMKDSDDFHCSPYSANKEQGYWEGINKVTDLNDTATMNSSFEMLNVMEGSVIRSRRRQLESRNSSPVLQHLPRKLLTLRPDGTALETPGLPRTRPWSFVTCCRPRPRLLIVVKDAISDYQGILEDYGSFRQWCWIVKRRKKLKETLFKRVFFS